MKFLFWYLKMFLQGFISRFIKRCKIVETVETVDLIRGIDAAGMFIYLLYFILLNHVWSWVGITKSTINLKFALD